jgi:hypothetical protein
MFSTSMDCSHLLFIFAIDVSCILLFRPRCWKVMRSYKNDWNAMERAQMRIIPTVIMWFYPLCWRQITNKVDYFDNSEISFALKTLNFFVHICISVIDGRESRIFKKWRRYFKFYVRWLSVMDKIDLPIHFAFHTLHLSYECLFYLVMQSISHKIYPSFDASKSFPIILWQRFLLVANLSSILRDNNMYVNFDFRNGNIIPQWLCHCVHLHSQCDYFSSVLLFPFLPSSVKIPSLSVPVSSQANLSNSSKQIFPRSNKKLALIMRYLLTERIAFHAIYDDR